MYSSRRRRSAPHLSQDAGCFDRLCASENPPGAGVGVGAAGAGEGLGCVWPAANVAVVSRNARQAVVVAMAVGCRNSTPFLTRRPCRSEQERPDREGRVILYVDLLFVRGECAVIVRRQCGRNDERQVGDSMRADRTYCAARPLQARRGIAFRIGNARRRTGSAGASRPHAPRASGDPTRDRRPAPGPGCRCSSGPGR